MHLKPPAGKYKRVVPLLAVHGWPGTAFEFMRAIRLLADPQSLSGKASNQMAFEVIVPNTPGYGFSSQPSKKGNLNVLVIDLKPGLGFCQVQTARIFNKLMKRLGFPKYIAQGGDWGCVVVPHIARLYPQRLVSQPASNLGRFAASTAST